MTLVEIEVKVVSDELKSFVKEQLRQGTVNVNFTKVDGTSRVMRCTLAESLIPEAKKPANTNTKEAETAQRAFDLDKQEWRSFRWESVKGIGYNAEVKAL